MLVTLTAQSQVKFPANLEHYDVTKALVDQEQIRGHHWSVIDKTARNAIPADKREIGMLVTWIEFSAYTTKRFQGANTTNAIWTNDLNWSGLIDVADTLTYADTSFFALIADTANFALIADTANFALIADTANFALIADTANFALIADTANFALIADTANFALIADTANFALVADTANFALVADTANFALAITALDSVSFSPTTKTGSHNEGNLIYDTDTKSLSFQNDIPDFNHNLGYELVARVYNQTGATILNGNVVRLVGNYKDAGKITPKIKLAGNSSADSTLVLGMATVDILPDSYGIVTLRGEVKGLNTSACSTDSCAIYLGFAGSYIDTVPEPPYYSVNLGQVYYADADSGRIFFNPSLGGYEPQPHIAADSSDIAHTITVSSSGVYYKLPFAQMQLRDNDGFILAGDSVQVLSAGHYNLTIGMSFNGNPTGETWQYGIFINGAPAYTKLRSTSSNATGDVQVLCYRVLKVGDWISFRIRNTAASGDPVIRSLSIGASLIHE